MADLELQRDAATARYGAAAERFLDAFEVGDPAGDELVAYFASLPAGRGRTMLERALAGPAPGNEGPAPIRRFLGRLTDTPSWVDWDQIEEGGRVVQRAGAIGAVALGLYTLPMTYRSPIGAKPLIFAGGLVARAPRRLRETARFVFETCEAGGMRPGGTGFTTTVRVRLMHAQVRRLLLGSRRWDARWGVPLCQAHLAAANAAISLGLLEGTRQLGCHIRDDEANAVVALWRYVGWMLGVETDLLASDASDLDRIRDLVLAIEPAPDDDSRLLVRVLMDARPIPRASGPWVTKLNYGVSRSLVGRDLAEQLDYPATRWRATVPLLRPVVRTVEAARRTVPGGRRLAERGGRAAWARTLDWVEHGSSANRRTS